MTDDSIRDVAICGGGLAGLTLALQLRLEARARSVVVLDRLKRPLPEAAFKVGEATVEVGAFYLAEVVGLREYLQREHLPKRGLRFFFGDTMGPLEERPEMGLSGEPPYPTYLFDRGKLENDLRDRIEAEGVELLEGCKIEGVGLSQKGEPHEIHYLDGKGGQATLRSRWVIDATGRRRLLQREQKSDVRGGGRCSAAWFRVAGRFSVRDLVPRASESWHDRVQPAMNRDLTVSHLVGRGYWVWIIPLPTDVTSVGIVVDQGLLDFAEFNTPDRARQWLRDHEPVLADLVSAREWLDFRVLHRYSYSAERVLSDDRWACVGEAAFFADPLNSPGTDVIGFSNCVVVDLIQRDFDGRLDAKTVLDYDRFLRGLNDLLTYQFQTEYGIFGNPLAATMKIIWNVASAWTIYSPQMFNRTFLDPEKREAFRQATMGYFFLTRALHALFQDWGARPPARGWFDLVDYNSLTFLREAARRNLQTGKSAAELEEDQRTNMRLLEEIAQATFLIAVEDQMPEHLDRFADSAWINAWKVGLDPDRWEADGLFEPWTEPRDLTPVRDSFRGLFRFHDAPVRG